MFSVVLDPTRVIFKGHITGLIKNRLVILGGSFYGVGNAKKRLYIVLSPFPKGAHIENQTFLSSQLSYVWNVVIHACSCCCVALLDTKLQGRV